jgi:hypothetical protein
MVTDYLPIQASAIPCECIFSSSTKTDTKRRNHIGPLMMEALQMLKFHLKKKCLNFITAWITTEKQMVDDCLNHNLLVNVIDEEILEGLDSILEDENL